MEHIRDNDMSSSDNVRNDKKSPEKEPVCFPESYRMEDITDNDMSSSDNASNDKKSPQSEEEPDVMASALTRSRLYAVGLGIFGAVIAGTIIYMSIQMTAQTETINDLTTERKLLNKERNMMEWMSQNNSKGCYTCLDHWILFRHKCYLFYDKPAPWKTWQQSRRFCQETSSDLVVIDDLEEQEFVSKHIKYYHSEQNGYWIGLQNVGNTWTWINGRADTLGFWAKDLPYTPGSKVHMLPGRKATNSWKQEMTEFLNKFICEIDAHKIPPY